MVESLDGFCFGGLCSHCGSVYLYDHRRRTVVCARAHPLCIFPAFVSPHGGDSAGRLLSLLVSLCLAESLTPLRSQRRTMAGRVKKPRRRRRGFAMANCVHSVKKAGWGNRLCVCLALEQIMIE